ncbi:hypothetical protein GCM10010420_06960 [Streptomyces glaucosporus]|uniref:Uncharacterized protein n=1 Tax=Streptomyces glaucosporus TaxID=284044 RepID=A0ABN3HSA5_9ACTN
MAGGEFEGKSLAALNAMVANANPKALTSRGDALNKAGSDMDKIGDELRTYIDRVKWEGQGADAFREWGQQFALETMRFAMYARTLGRHMVDAGQALTEVKAAIPEPEGMCYADPEKDKARQKEEEAKRQEAINQLNRLSSYYRAAGESIRGAEEPEFKPLPGENLVGAPDTSASSTTPSAGPGGSATTRETSVSAERTVSARDRAEVSPSPIADRPSPVAERPAPVVERPTHMTIDSVAPAPVSEARPQTANPAPSHPSTGPSTPSLAPIAPTAPIQRVGQTPSHTPVTGRSPAFGGGSVQPRIPSSNGVIGGMPRQVGSPVAGIPQGTVAGGDHTAAGRPVGGGSPGTVGGGTSANRGMYTGGPMGSQPGGAVGAQRTGSNHGRAFTPGGTGLVHGGTANPGLAARPTTTSPPPENRRRGSDRPDYLAEDEETWASRQRNVVPPIID